MQMVAEMWLILELTGSGVAVGVTSALQFLPILLFGAWGGVLADRWPKRSLLIVTQTAMAVPALDPVGADRDRRRRALDGLRARLRPRRRQLGRQPDPPELRDRDGRRRPGRQRGRPQQRPRPLARGSSARPGAGILIATVGVAPCFLINAATFAAMIVALRGMDPARLDRAAGADERRARRGRARRSATCAASRGC